VPAYAKFAPQSSPEFALALIVHRGSKAEFIKLKQCNVPIFRYISAIGGSKFRPPRCIKIATPRKVAVQNVQEVHCLRHDWC
jgi:hypothetical protein